MAVTKNMIANVEMLNAIRTSASAEYQDRIPVATQSNLNQIATAIFDYPTSKNELVNALTNKIGKSIFLTKLYENPYKFFKKGKLEFGKSIEAVVTDLVKAKTYNNGQGDDVASDLLKTEVAKMGVEYFTENFRHTYKTSFSDYELRGAIVSGSYGLESLINQILQSAINSAEYDEFLMMKKAICTVTNTLQIPNYATKSEKEQANSLTKTIKTKILDMGFLTSDYSGEVNGKKYRTFSKPGELVVIVKTDTKANIDVELLSQAFNIEKAEIESRLICIDSFTKVVDGKEVEDTDTLAVILDENYIQFHETENSVYSKFIENTLMTNSFVHRFGINAVCHFVNHLKITK